MNLKEAGQSGVNFVDEAQHNLATAALPERVGILPQTAEIQQKLSKLLALPLSEWNRATLNNGLREIALGVSALSEQGSKSSWAIGGDLQQLGRAENKNSAPNARAMMMVGFQLSVLEDNFESLSRNHQFRGEGFSAQTERLYASAILSAMAICAAETHDFGYLKPLLSSEKGHISHAAFCHIGDLRSELSGEPLIAADGTKSQLNSVLIGSLKDILMRDIDSHVAEYGLSGRGRDILVKVLEERPQDLKNLMQRSAEQSRKSSTEPFSLLSERVDQQTTDLATFRRYAYEGLSRSRRECPSVLELYCLL